MEDVDHSFVENKSTEIIEPLIQNMVEPNHLPNAVLKRLMEEVRNDNANHMFAYDRAHNRHNRGR